MFKEDGEMNDDDYHDDRTGEKASTQDRLENIVNLLARLAAVRYIEKQKSLNKSETNQ